MRCAEQGRSVAKYAAQAQDFIGSLAKSADWATAHGRRFNEATSTAGAFKTSPVRLEVRLPRLETRAGMR